MTILVDENIPLAAELFGSLGQIRLVAGRTITPEASGLEDVELMAIRSVTPVTRELLDKMPRLKAIGTATIGTDHIDMAAVGYVSRTRGEQIPVISAPGSNADSVADYVFHALFHLTQQSAVPLWGRSIAVVGVGNCGSRVASRAEALGMHILLNDPLRANAEPDFSSLPLKQVLRADFVTFHVPLTRPGESTYPTHHMINKELLDELRPECFLFNTSRGAVVNSPDLVDILRSGTIAGAVLDVYEEEPEPGADLVRLATLATPHVAGYAIEGKRRGAAMIYEGICNALQIPPTVDTEELMRKGLTAPAERLLRFRLCEDTEASAEMAVRVFAEETHDIAACSDELKTTLGQTDRGRLFDGMRKDYEKVYGRRELASFSVGIRAEGELREMITKRLAGFGVKTAAGQPSFWLEPETLDA